MIEVGRFCICGDWDDVPTPEGKLRIVMPPLGATYGGGWQPTTQAALLALPDHVTPDCSFAEIGAGSGILTVAAKLLGAGKCWATELSKDALVALAAVFAANGVDATIVDGTFPPEPVDLAVCSIATSWFAENRDKVLATKILNVEDDASVTIYDGAAEPKKFEPFAPVPLPVTMAQARRMLARAGLLKAVQAAVDALPADDETRIAWEYANEVHRGSPFVSAIGGRLNLTTEQLDGLFREASKIA